MRSRSQTKSFLNGVRQSKVKRPTTPTWAQVASAYDGVAGSYRKLTRCAASEVATIRSFLRLVPSTGRILEVGCGTGRLTARLNARRRKVFGIDLSGQMLAQARLAEPAALFSIQDAARLGFRAGTFAGVFAAHSLSHALDLRSMVAELRDVLRHRGVFCALLPLGSGSRILKRDELQLRIVLSTPTSISRVLSDCGFEIHSLNVDRSIRSTVSNGTIHVVARVAR